MNILLYKPPYYDLDKSAYDINFSPDEGIINNAINSFFLERTPTSFRWFETFRRDHRRRENYSPTYLSPYSSWSIYNPRKEVFKKLEVVSVY